MAAVEEQRFPVVAFHAFDFADEDGVIAGRVFSDDGACQFGKPAFQERDSAGCPAIPNAQPSVFFRGLLDFREIFGE